MDKQQYTVTIVIAAPGTPLYKNGEQQVIDGEPANSGPGHMFFILDDSKSKPISYGFAPITHGEMNGPGKIYNSDAKEYHNPAYSRTIEISKEQYEKLQKFGEEPEKLGFDKEYRDVHNNCVDFTWAALNHAGLHRNKSIDVNGLLGPGGVGQLLPDVRIPLPVEGSGKDAYRPLRNIHGVESIEAPFPQSPLNKEVRHPLLADRSIQQHLLSDQQQLPSLRNPDHPGHTLFAQAQTHVQALDQANNRQSDARSDNLAGCLAVQSCKMGMNRIDDVRLSEDASHAFAVQNNPNSLGPHDQLRAHVDTVVALNTPLEQSSQNWVQAAAERAHGEQQRQIQQEQSQPHPARALT
ncbi:XVIPCD domain-containing protein [Xanthomonas campestris pv. campestris]|uniref:XVIPCD domain-containing protein n=1 Tax=Xanthomonas campestris TaxID=339 RepID=UPI001F1BD7AC|nr:XVIPCD domain-containing protein [Xanthomonas campestris]MEB1181857.1 XVIPCD domain-containing protein [Xanthomonas campestris pv. campestris]MEB1905381.1 XVIPCD domain-containing protein [Xanthomonas campestris pv. campestris]MEB2016977.1 XVIPCD domain-containing protein [Xanthomonas campestris pv. campestris]